MDDIEVFEINEAFASQVSSVGTLLAFCFLVSPHMTRKHNTGPQVEVVQVRFRGLLRSFWLPSSGPDRCTNILAK